MTLEELVGEHELTGVDFGILPPNREIYRDEANTITFVLDGRAYLATEDPNDGYRSSMEDLLEVPVAEVKNMFTPCRVLARMRASDNYGQHDVLECLDVVTGKVVLEVGTENSDDYYPSYIATFTPEHMASNAAVSQASEDPPSADAVREDSR